MPMPDPARSFHKTLTHWLRARGIWMLVPAATLLGLLLFVMVWISQRPAAEQEGAANLPAVAAEPSQGNTLPAPQPPDPVEGAPVEEGDGGVFVLPDAPATPPAVAAEAPGPAGTGTEAGAPDLGMGAVDTQPVPVRHPQPTYPRRALRQGLSGEVVVRALVGTDGRPRQIEILRSSAHRELDDAALQAVRRWRFDPAMRDGQPVAQTVHVPFAFNP